MKKLNDTTWLILAILSTLVGFWLLVTEGFAHSKFFVYFILAPFFLLLWWKGRRR